MADAAGGPSSSTLEEYDVFLSFRGEDTRNNFTSHLHAALKRKNIKTYFDEESLERGKETLPKLLEAIQKSKISVIVFSKNYTSSSWCLRELAHIVQCHQEKGQIVFPIFHEVDPSHVRKQDGSYGNAFVKHEEDFKDNVDVVKQWRDSLRTSASLAGFNSQAIRPESKLIEDVVKAIWGKLCSSIVSSGVDSKGLFGFENQFKDIEFLLSIDSPDVRVVSIWGMGGIGKTTLADRIFSRFSSHFEGRCHFIRNLREKSEKCELEKSRDELFAKLLKEETANLGTLSIPDYMKERVSRTKGLIILDDVSDSKQLESLNVGDHVSDIGKQFGDGSRIVITTRDARVIRDIGANDFIYEVKNLKDDEGLQLFNLIAFRGNAPPSDYIELSNQVVKKVGGNPLAIKVLGSHLRSLRSPSKENWKMELDKLKEVPLYDIHKVLRISYHGLDDKEKNIFLDIACFFKGMSKDFIENILNCCGFFASNGIDNLIDKSLLSYNNYKLDMHDLVQEMGWEIVRSESTDHPGERSRLWTTKEACHALMNNDKGSKTIEGVFLDLYGKKDVHLRSTVFQEMRNLRFLSFYDSRLLGEGNRVIYSPYYRRFKVSLEALEFLPHSLRYLEWHDYPLNSLPSNFKAQNLVVLNMPGSQLEQLWNGVQELNNLKIMDLRHSYHLTQIPDLSRAPNLESINLPNCKSLIQFPWHSLQYLEKLAHLNLNACKKLNNVPDRIKGFILVGGCPNPNISAYLVFLWLYSAPIWPSSIGLLNNLSELCISGCKYLTNIPSSMRELDSLKVLTLYSCLSLEMFPELPRNIEEIIFFRTAIKEVPSASIKDCSSLWSIKLTLCSMLESLPTSVFELRSLASLELSESPNLKHLPEISEPVQSLCELNLEEAGIEQLPESIGNLVCIKKLNLRGCGNLRYLPLSIGNLLSLRELNLEETGIEHLPESIGNLLCLECLYLDFCNISEIPASIKRLPKLKSLSIEGLDNLVSLPVLPVSLQYLNAAECKSLKFVSLLIQGLGDNDEILEDSYEPFFFGNCLELDENAKLNIISWFQFRVLRMTTRFVPNEYPIYFSAKVGTCFPGFEIPKWFNHQSEGASVHINLPPQWHNPNFLGFAVCAVVREVESPIISLGCTIDLINAEEDRNFCWKFDCELFQYKFDSNHVCMWYEYHNYRHCADALEAKLNFSCIFEGLSDQGKLYVQIQRCGIRMLYREDLNKFRAQNLLLDQSAHVTDQPEPSTRGTFDSVSEEPRSTRTKHSNWLLLSQDLHNSKSF